tara:strand:+ start:33 stop:1349 length:1317 start_codon:yes stop_codon:yes gene_type:complete
MKKINLSGEHKVNISLSDTVDNLTSFKGLAPFEFDIMIDSEEFTGGEGISGDDALWFPLTEEKGLKLINDNSEQLIKNHKYLSDINLDIFPKIHWYETIDNYTLVMMENIMPKENDSLPRDMNKFHYLPREDYDFIFNNGIDIERNEKALQEFYKNELYPEDEWFKSGYNTIGGKIVDFHRFEHFPRRYKFDSNGIEYSDMHNLYINAIDRYSTLIDENGHTKWKGKIYQGFRFDNDYEMTGYKSSDIIPSYDSYLKMLSIPFHKVENRKVLDLGCNEGFLCYQAIIHGATEAIGVDLQQLDIDLANDLNEKIFKFDNVKFVTADAVEFIKNRKKVNEGMYERYFDDSNRFGLIILSSVLHQIYKNMEGSKEFLENIKKHTDYMFYETPVNHPLMKIPLSKIQNILEETFPIVRLQYVYDAYSSGYRAIFICYSQHGK